MYVFSLLKPCVNNKKKCDGESDVCRFSTKKPGIMNAYNSEMRFGAKSKQVSLSRLYSIYHRKLYGYKTVAILPGRRYKSAKKPWIEEKP